MSNLSQQEKNDIIATEDSECLACGEGSPINECSKSKRPCGHHCNHSWTHDYCCWCGEDLLALDIS